jgi:hypothetical protein
LRSQSFKHSRHGYQSAIRNQSYSRRKGLFRLGSLQLGAEA